ncbi:sulfotransferase domain-containing protein [Alicyclobacillus sp. SO9]|uniref:sulfotransferase domain-containing protein n=1 Tax=Alicyclobacillus sp. SO9 TaxID=2665646 RepID=UPI0018E73CCD|nr:sulfotransferase domain-containing protein [Alicyclobacillus sp. SO9]QQE80037.1 sulfotransferase domain-containing protein [Alicyclobacillus sp. SO9]
MNSASPKVLIVSIPKGGTNLLMQVILGIPGMVRTRHNMLTKAAKNGISAGEMGVMHLPYAPQFERALLDNNVKILFISRDLRDVTVSMMHFILSKFPSHFFVPSLQNI